MPRNKRQHKAVGTSQQPWCDTSHIVQERKITEKCIVVQLKVTGEAFQTFVIYPSLLSRSGTAYHMPSVI